MATESLDPDSEKRTGFKPEPTSDLMIILMYYESRHGQGVAKCS